VHFTLIFNDEFMDPSSIVMYICDHHAIVADTSSFFIKTCLLIPSLYINRHWHSVYLNLIKMGGSLNTKVILKYLDVMKKQSRCSVGTWFFGSRYFLC
jgi:hypothetical protein